MNSVNTPYEGQNVKQGAVIFSALFVAALLFLLGVGTSGWVMKGATQGGSPITTAKGTSDQPILEHTAGPSSTILDYNAPPSPPIVQVPVGSKMPPEVRAWLEHLERIEKKRRELATAQISEGMTSLMMLQGAGATMDVLKDLLGGEDEDASTSSNETPVEEIKTDTDRMKQDWAELTRQFHSLPPPAVCVPLANSYNQTLSETGSMIGEILGAIDTSSTDPKAAISVLLKMQGKSKDRIDVAAKQSDSNLIAVCDKYEEKPWFHIETDSGGGIMGKIGALGGAFDLGKVGL